MKEGVLILNRQDQYSLAPLRAEPGLLIAEREDQLWVRGFEDTPLPEARISALPATQVYYLGPEDQLFLKSGLTPVAPLPELDWQPLAAWMPLILPTSALPGKTDQIVPIQLQRVPDSGAEQTGFALLMPFARWREYVETAPQVRLEPLQFAVSKEKMTLVMGHPLPPVPGEEYWETDHLLLPAGYTLALPTLAPLVARKLNPAHDRYVRLDTSGKWELIPKDTFVPATRSAVRITAKGGQDE